MIILNGEARKLLLELIENKNSNLAEVLAAKFEGLDFHQDARLRATIKHLTDNGYLNIPKNGWANNVPYFATLTYDGENYLELEEQKMETVQGNTYNIGIVNSQGGNLILGNAQNAIQAIDSSVKYIEMQIEEKGGNDKVELFQLLEEAKKIVATISEHHAMPAKRGFFDKLGQHFEKHGWFYGAIVQLIGAAAVTLL